MTKRRLRLVRDKDSSQSNDGYGTWRWFKGGDEPTEAVVAEEGSPDGRAAAATAAATAAERAPAAATADNL